MCLLKVILLHTKMRFLLTKHRKVVAYYKIKNNVCAAIEISKHIYTLTIKMRCPKSRNT